MIEKAEDGDGDLLGHLMLTARKVAKEQGLEKVQSETPTGSEFLSLLRISEFFRFI